MISLSFKISPEEFKALLDELRPFFVRVDQVTDKPILTVDDVLIAFEQPRFPPLALTASLDTIIHLPMKIAKAKEPVIMLRGRLDGSLEALYPRLFQEAETALIHPVFPAGRFINTALFQKLQRWLRAHTRPQKDSPVRLGKGL